MKNTKKAEDKIREIINWISIMNNEEVEGANKKIEDETAKELEKKLRELAKIIGGDNII